MKICIINSLYDPYRRGGAEVVAERAVQGFVEAGHEVLVISVGPQKSMDKVGNVKVYRLTTMNIFSFLNLSRYPFWLRAVWHIVDVFNVSGYVQVKKILQREKPAAVVSHNVKGLGYLVPAAIRRTGIFHIHTIHDVQLSRPSGLLLYGSEKPFLFFDKAYEKICRYLFGSPDVVVSPSSWLMHYYRQRGFFYHSRCEVMPNPVEIRKVRDEATRVMPQGVMNLLYVGQLERFKGVQFLIEACKKLPAEGWHLTIIGGGGAQSDVERLIAGDQRFNFKGPIFGDAIVDYFRQADLVVVPSFCYENSPMVIFESLAANTPVVAADIGGMPEIIRDDVNGFTFAPGNEQSLLDVLNHFLVHPENIEQLRKNCFVSVLPYSTKNYIKKLTSLISQR